MTEKKLLPDHALIVYEYQELRQLVLAFANGHHELMTIVGDGGVGKSELVKRSMLSILGRGKWALIKGKHSPLDLYQKLLQHALVPLVFDDLDGLFLKPDNVALLKCVCDTTAVKVVEWGSTHAVFRKGDPPLPTCFESISRVLILANEWQTLRRNVVALQDRGVLVVFKPSSLEVHREIARAGWFDDAEVFEFLGRNLHLVTQPSFRLYITARSHKRAGLDWKNLILRTIESEADAKLVLVARLLADSRFDSLKAPEAARERAFKDSGGGSRASYHRHKSELYERRGNYDLAAAQAIVLSPPRPDPYTAALAERRRQLEELRDALHSESTEDDSGAPPSDDSKSGASSDGTCRLDTSASATSGSPTLSSAEHPAESVSNPNTNEGATA